MNSPFTISHLRAGGRFCGRRLFVLCKAACAVLWLLFAPVLAAFPAQQSTEEIPPLAPPLPELALTFWEQHAALVVVGIGLLLGFISVAIWWALRPKPPVLIPPAVQAREQLNALAKLSEDGAVLSRVSQGLRRYFIAAFGMTAGELTTTEFCVAVAAHESIGAELAARIGGFLRACDERKFAPVPNPVSLGAARGALELVELAEARCAQLRTAAQAAPADTRK